MFFQKIAPVISYVLIAYFVLLFLDWFVVGNQAPAHEYESFQAFRPSNNSQITSISISGQRDSVSWARAVLANASSYLIVDTETTGLSGRDEIVEIGVVDLSGNTVFHSYVRPPKRRKMPPDAEFIHKISLKFLKDKPTMAEIIEPLRRVLYNKTLISYNAEFDEKLFRQTCKKYELSGLSNRWECAMLPYAAWVGEWNDYHGDYKWQKLPSAGHDALSDCLATRKIIIEMAGGKA